jgi:hypothetical protein
MTDPQQEIDDLKAEIKRLAQSLHYEQWLAGRQGSHGPGCWKWGPAHYRCALNRIEELQPKDQTS